ncbi:MAG TPA: aminotransferase class V-fold PLP-dependent enzyme, partial [Firmicutes bacterium]|nr:aminotransferase class V-fold PLP-dependent enzyme [Bacillota bacterium]
MIYLDNAATSHKKPVAVVSAVTNYLTVVNANPGRSGHLLSAGAARIVFDAREALARLLNVADSRQLIFTKNATESLNIVLRGWLRPGDHVVTTSLEHNSVMRPLRHLEQALPCELTVVGSGRDGLVDPAAIGAALRPDTRLVVVNHASNVCGTIAPLAEIRAAIGETPLLVDG